MFAAVIPDAFGFGVEPIKVLIAEDRPLVPAVTAMFPIPFIPPPIPPFIGVSDDLKPLTDDGYGYGEIKEFIPG